MILLRPDCKLGPRHDLRNAEKALAARAKKSIEDNRSALAWHC